MKKMMTLAAATLVAAPVLAQSSLTMYGIADMALVHNSNVAGPSRVSLDSGYLQSSRLGFRGVEDLGGGLRSLFTLESGYNLDTGTNTSTVFFNRQAFVGLASDRLGALTLGRQYTPIYDNLILLAGAPTFGVSGGSVDGIALPGSTPGRFDNTLGGTRIDNSIKYSSPGMGGFKVNAMWGLGEVAGSSSASRVASLGAAYYAGRISAGAGYMTRNCPAQTGCTATQAQDKVLAIGGGYDFGPAALAGIYSHEENGKNVAGSDANVYHVMVTVPVGAVVLAAGYQRLNDRSSFNQDIRQVNLSAVYYLSKRTSLYASFSNQSVANGGKASLAVTISSDGHQNLAAFGVRHTF